MGSQTYVEDFESSYKSTWTISFSSSSEYNVITPNETLTVSSPTVTAKYVGSGKGYAVVDISGGIYNGDPTWGEGNFLANWKRYRGTIKNGETQRIATTSGTTYTLSVGGTFIGSNDATFNVTASSLFNENNKNTNYVYLWAAINYGVLESSDSSYNHYNAYPNYGWGRDYDNAMTAIKINYRCPPSVTIGSPSYANPQYAGFGAYSVPLTRLVAEYGGNITSVKLTVGASSTTQTYSTNTVTNKTISVVPSTAGESIIPILEVTDSRGVVNSQPLSPIDVLEYDKPSVNFDVYRTDSIGKKADEGKYAIIDAQVTFTSGAVTIKEKPTVIIDGTDKTSNVTWYPNWNASDGKSGNEITTWSSVSSGSHIYGLINGNFSETSSYSVTMTAKDTANKVSDPITQTLSTAFYTIDFQAGGKEIAFGAPANDSLSQHPDGLFKCAMDAQFEGGVSGAAFLNMFYPVGSYYETSDTTFNPNVTWGGTWILETEGQVHISSGSNYLVNGAVTNTSDGGSPYIQEHTHAFTQPKIPNHHHSMGNIWSNGTGSSQAYQYSNSRTLMTRNTATDGGGGACTGGAVGAVSGATTGNSGNMPPYIVVNRWHRTA